MKMYRVADRRTAAAIEAAAAEQGFVRWGCADASSELSRAGDALEEYLSKGYNGDMEYMSRNRSMRLRPKELDGRSGTLLLFLAPYPMTRYPEDLKIASYARGKDYHIVLKMKLNAVADAVRGVFPELESTPFTDSAPILERAFAVEAGMGFIGRNGMFIDRIYGNRIFICSLLCNVPLTEAENASLPVPGDSCGRCTRCMDACPTGAIVRPFVVDARRCISYQTIESRRPYDEEDFRIPRKGWIFGCDECLRACPWYGRSPDSGMPEFAVNGDLIDALDRERWNTMGSGEFKRLFAATPLLRAGLKKIRNNISALENGSQAESENESE